MKVTVLAVVAAVLSLTACGTAQHGGGAAQQTSATSPATHTSSPASRASVQEVSLESCFASPAGVGTEAVVQFPAPPATPGVATWKAQVAFGTHAVTADNAAGSVAHAASYIESSSGGALPCRLLESSRRVNGVWEKVQGAGPVMRPTSG